MKQHNENQAPNCAFCGKPLSIPVLNNIYRNGVAWNISECAECQIAMVHPFPSDSEINNLYSSENYRTGGGTRFNFFIERLIQFGNVVKRKHIEKYVKAGKILDVGCGRGLFLNTMRRGGWDVVGSELNQETASYARNVYGLKVYTGEVAEQSFASESFNVINICGVLEHLKEPNALLSETHKLLMSEGLLVILVPDIRSFEFKFGKESWFHLDLPFHLFHFSEDGLVRLLRKKGFKLIKVKRFHLEYSPFGWLQTFLNFSNIRFNLFYNLLKSRNLKMGAGGGRLILMGLLRPCFCFQSTSHWLFYFPFWNLFFSGEAE